MINTHNVRIEFGKHGPRDGVPGELFTRLPISYLKWMVAEKIQQSDLAESELERRGVVKLDVEISDHAIDRAVEHCHATFIHDKNENEGITNWLRRLVAEALEHTEPDQKGRHIWKKMKLKIDTEKAVPYLVTITRAG